MKKENSRPAAASTPGAYHVPVLLAEVLEGLQVRPSGTYVDCTFGGGGHSSALLAMLGDQGRVFAFDQDADAKRNVPDDRRIVFVPQNFRHLQRFLRLHGVLRADGMIADLGVSSYQFDQAKRGFSYRFEGYLDMRMDSRQTLTAADVVNQYEEKRLQNIFERFGEVTNARTLAREIVQQRKRAPVTTTRSFTAMIAKLVKGNPHKYFAQVFQSLRMEVNDELNALKEMLDQSLEILGPEGRLAVITFHSLEDRMVKNFFKKGTTTEPQQPDDPFGHASASPWRIITKKPLVPGQREVQENPRSRSAKLRIAEKK